MKVSVSQIENSVVNSGMHRMQATKKSTSFGGSAKVNVDTVKAIQKELPWIPKALLWIDKNKGEIPNSIITALGTAIIAPIFIAFNPFSKEDKETKIYSAWRQPISAVLALAAQIGINIKFNNYMDRIASTKQFLGSNIKADPAKSYLESVLKLTHPEYTKKDRIAAIELEKQNAFRKEVIAARSELRGKPITNEMLVGRDDFAKAREQLSVQYKNEMAKMSKKDADAFINKKAVDTVAENIMSDLKLNAEKKFMIRQFKNAKTTVDGAIAQTTQKLAAATTDREKTLLKSVLEQLDVIKVYEKQKGLPEFSSVKNLGSTFEEILHNVKIKQTVVAATENSKFALGQYKLWLGIGISLLTLPISCGLLNWSYPRIMEKIMPHANRKHHHHAQQPQQVEQKKEVKA